MLFPRFLNADVVRAYCRNMGNRIFTVVFEKDNGTRRSMNCRLHVTKGLKSTNKRPKTKKQDNVMVVFDLKARGYRSFHLDKVFSIQSAGSVLAPKAKFRKPRPTKLERLAAVATAAAASTLAGSLE